jgi:hypothetical protein
MNSVPLASITDVAKMPSLRSRSPGVGGLECSWARKVSTLSQQAQSRAETGLGVGGRASMGHSVAGHRLSAILSKTTQMDLSQSSESSLESAPFVHPIGRKNLPKGRSCGRLMRRISIAGAIPLRFPGIQRLHVKAGVKQLLGESQQMSSTTQDNDFLQFSFGGDAVNYFEPMPFARFVYLMNNFPTGTSHGR